MGYVQICRERVLCRCEEDQIGVHTVDIVKDDNGKSIVTAIVSLAKHLEMKVVAVGVTNLGQSKALSELGVKVISGEMAGEPMTSDQVFAHISR